MIERPEVPVPPILNPSRGPRLGPAQLRQRFKAKVFAPRRSGGNQVQIVLCGDVAPDAPRSGGRVGNAKVGGEVSRGRPHVEDRFHTQTLCAMRSDVNAFCVVRCDMGYA